MPHTWGAEKRFTFQLLYLIGSIYYQTSSRSVQNVYYLIQQRYDISLKLTQIVIGLHKTIVLASYKCVVLEPRSVCVLSLCVCVIVNVASSLPLYGMCVCTLKCLLTLKQ